MPVSVLENIFDDGFRVGVFGRGVSGEAVSKWCTEHGVDSVTFDENSGQAFTESIANSFNLIVRSPSFLDDHPWVRLARISGVPCIGELDLAAGFWKGNIVAVTGTDGKTTVVEFLKHAMRSAGYGAIAVGNIGIPFIGAVGSSADVPGSWAIVEVSSFQAQQLQIMRPDYILWTNFAMDHIDAHGSLEEYFESKYRLVEMGKFHDAGHVFVGKSVKDYARRHQKFDLLGDVTICRNERDIPQKSCFNTAVQRSNFALVRQFWMSCGFETCQLEAAAETFSLPKHRLQKVASLKKINSNGDKCEVEFWNDSKATNFHSFSAALKSFDEKLILIVGGKSKGESVKKYVNALLKKAKVLLLLGETGMAILEALNAGNHTNEFEYCEFFGDRSSDASGIMQNIVQRAFSVAGDSDVVLLCPGFSSLDMFSNYEQRGLLYEKYILRLRNCV